MLGGLIFFVFNSPSRISENRPKKLRSETRYVSENGRRSLSLSQSPFLVAHIRGSGISLAAEAKARTKKRTFSWILMQSIPLLESAKTVQFCLASAIVKMTQTSPLFASFPFVILCAWICLLLPATNAISCYQCNSMPLASKKSECPGQSISFGDRHDVS